MEASCVNIEEFLVARVKLRRTLNKLRRHEAEEYRTSGAWAAEHLELQQRVAMAEEGVMAFPPSWGLLYLDHNGPWRKGLAAGPVL